MSRPDRYGLILALLALVALAAGRAVAADVGTYQGAGCDGVKGEKNFAKWLGRNPDLMLDFIAWDMLETRNVWAVKCWSDAGQKKVVFSIPMLPGSGATLADGAAGKFDALFHDYAAVLVRYGYGDSILRIGWEFNGNWYPWAASKDPDAWIAYWRRIVTAMRSVPGANFRFDWNPASGWNALKADRVWPGDDYVDIVGLDLYNVTWNTAVTTPQQLWQEMRSGAYGLEWQRDFAAAHRKPRSLPEWATGIRPADGKGGGDDPYFIEQVAAWIGADSFIYHNYWDYANPPYNGKLSDGHQPRAAGAYLKAFGHKPRAPVLR